MSAYTSFLAWYRRSMPCGWIRPIKDAAGDLMKPSSVYAYVFMLKVVVIAMSGPAYIGLMILIMKLSGQSKLTDIELFWTGMRFAAEASGAMLVGLIPIVLIADFVGSKSMINWEVLSRKARQMTRDDLRRPLAVWTMVEGCRNWKIK